MTVVEQISVDRIDDVHGFFIQIYNIQSEKYFAAFPHDMFFFFAIDMDTIDVNHNPFSIYIIVLFGGFTLFMHDILEVLERKFFVELLENIKSKKTKSAFIQHKIMMILGIFSRVVGYLDEILMKHILQNLFLLADLVHAETRMRR